MTVESSHSPSKPDATLQALRWASRFYRASWRGMAGVAVFMLFATMANVLKPWPVAVLIDAVLGGKPLPGWAASLLAGKPTSNVVLILAFMASLLQIGQALLVAGQNFFGIRVSLEALARVRQLAFEKLQKLSWKFHQGNRAGDLLYRILWDTYSVQTLFQQGAVTCVASLLGLLIMAGVMFGIDGTLTWLALGTAPMLVLVIRWLGPIVANRGRLAQNSDAEVSAAVQQGLHRLPLIQSYNLERQQTEKFSARVEDAMRLRLRQHGAELAYGFGVTAVFAMGLGAILYLGGHRVNQGSMSVGQLFVFLSYLGLLYEPLNQLSHVGATLATAASGVRRIREVVEAEEEIAEPQSPQSLSDDVFSPQNQGGLQSSQPSLIRFSKVTFGYQPDRPVIKDFDWSIRRGEVVGVIGPSGAGKSTLLNLIPRFFDPQSGEIEIGGINIKKLRLSDLRSHVGMVMQETILMDGTIAENIAMGAVDHGMDRVKSAAQLAGADAFIESLPEGYQTRVGEGEVRLSVGERQRLSLARAFFKNAPILLLDEPTSALDADSEAKVLQGLSRLVQGRTTIIVSHRAGILRLAHRLVVLEQGVLTAQGSPEELLQAGGYYRRMVETPATS